MGLLVDGGSIAVGIKVGLALFNRGMLALARLGKRAPRYEIADAGTEALKGGMKRTAKANS